MPFEMMDPSGAGASATYDPAPRLATLEGASLGLLDNGKTNAAKFLNMVAEILVAEHGVADVTMYRKEALSKPAPKQVIDKLVANSDFGVTGIGDCGSCSTNSIHDGIEVEKLGVPCIAVTTEAFLPGIDAICKMRGMAGYGFAVVPHPLGVLFDDELRGRAEAAAAQIAPLVIGQVPAARVA